MNHRLSEEADMTATKPSTGSAGRHGEIWGARAGDWSEIEDQQAPTYDEGMRRLGITPGQLVLDVGCGSGAFLRAAADRGARVCGLDASERLLELARARVPEADLRVGDMQFLPYEDDLFDAVTGFNSFFFAADMTAALREARRVAKPGAPVLIQVWGHPDRCDLTAMKPALASLRAASEPGPPAPPLWEPGVLERVAASAGLAPQDAFDVSWAYEYADEDALARAMLSPGLVVEAIRTSGEAAVRDAIVAALAPYRSASGGYRLQNEWHYLVARA
jgi:SAM-dependent methyltransferase